MIIVLDTETTGIDPELSEVVELAGASLDPKTTRPLQAWSALIKPGGPIPPAASAVHHLTSGDFAVSYPDLATAWSAMSGILSEQQTITTYVAHNAAFDKGFLTTQAGEGASWLCTWRCALHLLPDAPGYGNQVLRYYLGLQPVVPENLAPHRALYDTLVTVELLCHLLRLKPLDELLKLQHNPVLMKTCGFGKHRGVPWKEVPRDYLAWILRNGEFDSDTLYTAKHYLR